MRKLKPRLCFPRSRGSRRQGQRPSPMSLTPCKSFFYSVTRASRNLSTYLFSFWLLWISIAAHGLSLGAGAAATLAAVHRCFFAVLLWFRSSALRCTGFRSCGAGALLPWGMWNRPRPWSEPMSPALAGRFLTPGPPGKSCRNLKVTLSAPLWAQSVEIF